MKTSNKFTVARVFSSPILFLIYFIPVWTKAEPGSVLAIASMVLSIPLLAAAELTDYFDGHYARLHNEVSDFGKMFDPFADVFLHLSMFTCFVFSGYMPVCFYIPILYREFSQNFLRMVAAKSGTAIAARQGGKVKTVFYVASCFVALAQETLVRTGLVEIFGLNNFVMDIFRYVGYGFFGVCVLLAYTSFIDYLKNFGKILKENI
ncbi:CDP-diacylglycerol--glycerol-3-phosphate 3-phosphatidyltransferase [Treponema sp.]|uniref:CDP-diacylglycerol--glycerol-3-phosphate 3-phosphatidyltransferase n=1 Tax=Treponema sp. TaxID=166 RepID=UPI00389106CF